MHLLAYWRFDNYRHDLDEGAGFHFNSRQSRLHTAIEPGESLWLFTMVPNPPRYYVVARLVVSSKTVNPTGYKYGAYHVWGDLERSRYFKVRLDVRDDEAFDLLRGLPMVSGSLESCTRHSLPQACQTIRGLTPQADTLLEHFTLTLPDEERAMAVVDEYALERELLEGDAALETILRDHTGPSEERRQRLFALAPRDRQLHDRYVGKCQLCAFDSPMVYGTPSTEAHHIVYLSRGGDDNLLNMVLLCPNHHTVVHRTNAAFDYARLMFHFPNGRVEPLCLNTHLPSRTPAETFQGTLSEVAGGSSPADLQALTATIVSHLTPDLLTPAWAASRQPDDHPLTGYCYVAAEALYHLAGGAASGLSVFRCSLPNGGTHWWLADAKGRIIDPTAEQFGEAPPYAQGEANVVLVQEALGADNAVDRDGSSRAAKSLALLGPIARSAYGRHQERSRAYGPPYDLLPVIVRLAIS